MKKILLTIAFYASISLYAHPHFFIDSNISFEDGKIKNEWLFDRLNSRVLLFDFDRNSNKKFDEDEKKEFIKTHFKSLEANNYNIFLASDEEYKIKPSNIDVKFEAKRVSLSFDIDVKLSEEFTMCTMDEKIYMAYKLNEINSHNKLDVQKSEYDFCLGASNE